MGIDSGGRVNSFDLLRRREAGAGGSLARSIPSLTDEENATRPLRESRPSSRGPACRVPWYQVERPPSGWSPRGLVLVLHLHRRGGDLGVGRRAARLDGGRGPQLQRPERQVDPVAAEVAHGPVAEVPPAVPLGSGQVHVAVRPGGSRALARGPSRGLAGMGSASAGRSCTKTMSLCSVASASVACHPHARATHTWHSLTCPDRAGPAPAPPPGGSCRWRGSACPSAWRRRRWAAASRIIRASWTL